MVLKTMLSCPHLLLRAIGLERVWAPPLAGECGTASLGRSAVLAGHTGELLAGYAASSFQTGYTPPPHDSPTRPPHPVDASGCLGFAERPAAQHCRTYSPAHTLPHRRLDGEKRPGPRR